MALKKTRKEDGILPAARFRVDLDALCEFMHLEVPPKRLIRVTKFLHYTMALRMLQVMDLVQLGNQKLLMQLVIVLVFGMKGIIKENLQFF